MKPTSSFLLFTYYIFALLLYIVALPVLIYMLRKSKYRLSLPKRFFPLSNKSPKDNSVHFHTCSFGETASMVSIASDFVDDLHFSVITDTGYKEAMKITPNVSFLPYEIFLPFWLKHSKLLVVAEAELWLMLFAVAKLKGSKTAIINARISDKSYKSYRRFWWFYRFLFSFVDLVLAQSQKDKERLQELGAKNIIVTGNTKISQKHNPTKIYQKDESRLILTAASTHFGEEEIIFAAFCDTFKGTQAKLIIVPRHPERFDSVDLVIKSECEKKEITYSRFSQSSNFDSTVTLVDTMGELINIYAISDIVVLGGAFANIGGHNPIEPASFGCKIISGKNIHNHKATFEVVDGFVLCESYELQKVLKSHESIQKSSIITQKDPAKIAKEKLHELLSSN
jgi:3-deoxy-D-manno-octulosonic-acid transferase